ncbi:MAG TPA: arylsulfotransferase family protein [Flavilitoribacter sp.]|nr:arylsulfotransferase family protein [Flavilitoribacter sp.]
MRTRSIAVSLFLSITVTSIAQTFNRPVPAGVPPYEFIRYDDADHGYYLTAPFYLGTGPTDPATLLPKPILILDADGYILWFARIDIRSLVDFKYFPADDLYGYTAFQSPQDIRFVLMDRDFQPVDSFTTVNSFPPDVHDFQITQNGTYLISGLSDKVVDLSGYLINGEPGSAVTHAEGFVVQEFDQEHNLLFQWDSNDYIHPSLGYESFGYNPDGYDYCHGNAIEEDDDGNLLISFRHLNAVYKINRQTGDVIWQLGGKTSSFTFVNDPGFSGQHDVRRLPNGNLTVFDNANTSAPPRVSRGVEYALDTVNWTATRVWEYQYTPGFFARAMGSHRTTPDRNHLINYGMSFRPNPSFVLTDDDGNLLSQVTFPDSIMSYRSFLEDIPFDVNRPEISCSQGDGMAVLSAPPGFDRYEWSNGATADMAVITQPGVYQVWVDHGIGMLGSEPFTIDDINNACRLNPATEPEPDQNREITGYFDLMGRRIAAPRIGEVYVVRYRDGWSGLRVRGE